MRELAALSTLAAAWSRSGPREIADGLAHVLSRALPVAFVYVRVSSPAGKGALEVARTPRGPTPAGQVHEIGKELEPLLKPGSPNLTPAIANPFGSGTLRLAILPIGCAGDCGVLVAGSPQPDFPGQTDRLLLSVAANQAAVVLQRLQAEEALRRRERELADFFENATIGLNWVGPDGTLLRANQAELQLLGYSAEEYIGHHIAEFHADKDVIEDILRRLHAGEELHEYEARLRCKDGSLKHVLLNSNVLWEDGQFIHTRCFTRDITDRKRAETALRDSERRFREMIDALPAAIYTTDAQGRLTHFNPACIELSGRQPELGTDHWCVTWKLYHPDGRPMPHEECPMAVALKEGRAVRGAEAIAERPDGTRIWFTPYPTPLCDADGRVIGGINMLVDITERKQAEEANARLAAIVESSDDAIVSKNLHGIITSWNRGAERIFGYTAEEAIGQPVTMLMPSDRVNEEPGILERIRHGEKIDHYETIRRRKDGTLLTISLSISPVCDAHGNIVGASKIARDISHRKQAEQRLRLLWEAAAVLLTANDPDAMLRELFAKIGPHLGLDTYFNYMVDESGEALRLESCLGIPDRTARSLTRLEFGQSISGAVALQRQPIVATHIQQSDDPKVQSVKSFGIRACACNPLLSGGQLLGTLSFASRTRDHFAADELAFLETICHYVTGAYERLRLLGQLKEADRRKDEFLATLAHELRNPLAPIRNAVQVLRLKGSDEPELRWGQDVIERQVSHLTRLIDDLLDISRITRNKLELRKERVDLAEVVKGAVETSRPLIEQGGHELTVTLPTEPISLYADLVRLAQVFMNLLTNAAKYTDRGGRIGLTASLEGDKETRRQGDKETREQRAGSGVSCSLSPCLPVSLSSWVVVRVKDTGVGIPAEKLPRLFEMFFQVDRSVERSQGGLGIGLSLVRRLVELHGGSVKAHSAGVGKGSEFIVRLPILAEMPKPQPLQEPIDNGKPKAMTARRILVVDDIRDSADSLAMLLRLGGNEVQTAYDGLAAVEAAERLRPDVVLLDIGMPKLNGYEACRRLREQPWGQGLLLVALTGWGQEEDKRRTEEAGFDAHLVKPVDPNALMNLLVESHKSS
jgi:PAS domain S-box-containing protein